MSTVLHSPSELSRKKVALMSRPYVYERNMGRSKKRFPLAKG